MSTPPNIVWLTMESTRADHTSIGVYNHRTTPNLERIANTDRGRGYSNCFSHGIWTRASSASILTGTYPSRHGAGIHRDAIPTTLPTVPELLTDAGYHTLCYSPNAHLSSATGLDRGFDEFNWIGKSTLHETVGLRSLLRYAMNVRSHGGGFTRDTRKHGTDYMMTDAVKRRLRSMQSAEEPFFLYLHYGGPHHPYHPPVRYFRDRMRGREMSRKEASALALSHHADLHEHIADGCQFSRSELDVLEALYDGEIEHTDALIGELFDYLTALDDGNLIVVVTGDHGELFGEQDLLSHVISTDRAVSQVPMVVYGIDGLPDETGALVQHIDVMQTILAEIGIESDHHQGIDLRDERREYAIVQRGGNRCQRNVEQIRDHNPDFDASRFPDSTVTVFRGDDYVFKQWDGGNLLAKIPDEESDVSEQFPAVKSEFESRLTEWIATEGRALEGEQSRTEMSGEMRSQLENLGYLVE